MKNIKKIAIIGILLSLFSCGKKQETTDSDKLKVVCTVGMIADLVKVIGGEAVEVQTIIGAGADPHVYKHTTQDMKKLDTADLTFYNGYHLEGKMGNVLEGLQKKGQAVHAVAEAVVQKEGLLKDEAGAEDPHLWMDVSQWRKVAGYIHTTLAETIPEHAETMEANYNDLDLQLDALHFYAQDRLSTIPEQQRYLITAHDAFGYMESAYGIRVRGIQGLSTESQAGLKEMEDLISFLVKKKIPAVFTESSVNDKNVRALIEGTKAKGHEVVIGGELFSDAMGPKGTYEGTYIGMIDHNITVITNALGGTAPREGCFAKLAQ